MYLGVHYVSEISTIDGASFVPSILKGDNDQLNYQTIATKTHQEKPGPHSWILWKRILQMLTPTLKVTTNKFQEQLGPQIKTHSECGKWPSYQERNGSFYARKINEYTEWKVYKRTNKGSPTQLTCIDTTKDYQPKKYSTPVRIHKSTGGKIYTELGVKLKIDKALSEGPAESFKELIENQPQWIRNLVKFVRFTPDSTRYGKMDTTIDDMLTAHSKDGYLVAVSDRSVEHMHQMSFSWVLSTAKGLHLAKLFGACDDRGRTLRDEQ